MKEVYLYAVCCGVGLGYLEGLGGDVEGGELVSVEGEGDGYAACACADVEYAAGGGGAQEYLADELLGLGAWNEGVRGDVVSAPAEGGVAEDLLYGLVFEESGDDLAELLLVLWG